MNLFLKLIFGTIIMFAALQTNAKISVEEFYDIKFNSIDGNKISLDSDGSFVASCSQNIHNQVIEILNS